MTINNDENSDEIVMNIQGRQHAVRGFGRINIIMGKNGCGKSLLLRAIDQEISKDKSKYGVIKYITPERGGSLVYNASITDDITGSPNWSDSRRTNRHDVFRQQSAAQFNLLKTIILEEIEKNQILRNNHQYTFDTYIQRINYLLENIELKRETRLFEIYKKGTGTKLEAQSISSGESELIALAIECLVFEKECDKCKQNYLILDEPDVHLHPDLQEKLCGFLIDITSNIPNATIILATHSTAILGALSETPNVHIEFMRSGQEELQFKTISNEYKQILPIFGAHPLSNIFNNMPIFLLEGDDDVRIWQQAVRTSNCNFKIYPCAAGSKDELNKHEQAIEQIIFSVYDNAQAYSLRDRDDEVEEDISDLKVVKRARLSCRSAENLLLTDEVLESCKFNWKMLQQKIEDWLDTKKKHKHFDEMQRFKSTGYNRKNFDLKEIRNDLLSLMETPCTWELLVGRTIGNQIKGKNFSMTENSIGNYLGNKLIDILKNLSD